MGNHDEQPQSPPPTAPSAPPSAPPAQYGATSAPPPGPGYPSAEQPGYVPPPLQGGYQSPPQHQPAGGSMPPPPPPQQQDRGHPHPPPQQHYGGPAPAQGYPAQGYPAYSPQPVYTPPGTTAVYHQMPAGTTAVIVSNQNFGHSPTQCHCPNCNQRVISQTHKSVGLGAWVIAGIICLFCFLFAWLPFCIDSCKDTVHTCPNCRWILATKAAM